MPDAKQIAQDRYFRTPIYSTILPENTYAETVSGDNRDIATALATVFANLPSSEYIAINSKKVPQSYKEGTPLINDVIKHELVHVFQNKAAKLANEIPQEYNLLNPLQGLPFFNLNSSSAMDEYRKLEQLVGTKEADAYLLSKTAEFNSSLPKLKYAQMLHDALLNTLSNERFTGGKKKLGKYKRIWE